MDDHGIKMQPLLIFRTPKAFLLLIAACLWIPIAQAGPFEPIVQMDTLDASDRLVINRGGPVHNAGDFNGDGFEDLVIGAGQGAVRVIFGLTNGDNGQLNAAIQAGIGGFGISGGASVVGGGSDFNGDGLDDVVIGSSEFVHVIFGKRAGHPSILDVEQLDGSDGFTVLTAGSSVAIVPDINADGLADLIIGSRHRDAPGFRDAGMVTVVYGSSESMPASLSPFNIDGENGFLIYGESTLDLLGWSVEQAGDINSDGIQDLVLGAPGAQVGNASEAGKVYVIYGSENRPTRLDLGAMDEATGFVFSGEDAEDSAGYSVRGIGDLNGDGVDDLAIGAPGKGPTGSPNLHPGEVYVIFGDTDLPGALAAAQLNGSNGFTLSGIRGGTVPLVEGVIYWGDQAGSSVSGAGDFNGDGLDDMIIGAPYTIINNQRRGNGQAYLIYGRNSSTPFPARISLAELDGESGFYWNGVGTTDYTGATVSSAGDFNDDGIDDVLVGASGQGESYVFYGRRGDVNP